MTRLSRVEVFATDEVAIVHVINPTVRRCFSFGDDLLTQKNYDHRKAWVEQELEHPARFFSIDLLCRIADWFLTFLTWIALTVFFASTIGFVRCNA